MSLMPQTVSAKDIQRNYRRVFDLAKKTKQPVVVLTNNKPDVAIIDAQELDAMKSQLEELELHDVLRIVQEYKKDKKEGRLIEAESVLDLIKPKK
ncbi:hypothetical protein A2W24_00210 [Microgenomates group bacterium RBG_16_45_19]|nr:MAG: hypothetical protein A2W24_00210 [Microgenomates group bacterium RBG_16_45_19]